MTWVRNVIETILALLFPEARRFARFDSISQHTLAQTALRCTISTTDVPCIAPLPYHHLLVRDAIHAAKYHGHRRAATLLGATIASFLGEELAERRMFGTFETALVIPIPLHERRAKERGYNQAERIARACVDELCDASLTFATNILVRQVYTPTQTHRRGRTERRENVRGAFRAIPEGVAGHDIILIDDVVTTGATLHAAAVALTNAGARNVLCVAAAH